jgi:hypothetical protein
MPQVPVSKREQAIALKIVGMLREECRDDLLVAVRALALANQMFQEAFKRTVSQHAGLQKRLQKGKEAE